MSNKTAVDIYKELPVPRDYESWAENEGKNKIKKTGSNGTTTALDETENRAMYQLYVDSINAENAKKQALELSEKNKAQAMRENAILLDRAKEYAERRAALSGMAKTGVSQTAMIDLYSDAAKARAITQANYDNQENSILQEYREALKAANSNADTVTSNVAIQRATNKEAALENLYQVANNYSSESELTNAIDEYERLYGAAPEEITSRKGKLPPQTSDMYKKLIDADEKYKGGTVVMVGDAKHNREYNGQTGFEGKSEFNLPDISNKYENKLLRMVHSGELKDGTVIEDKKGTNGYYVYLQGAFYRIEKASKSNFGSVITLNDEFLK